MLNIGRIFCDQWPYFSNYNKHRIRRFQILWLDGKTSEFESINIILYSPFQIEYCSLDRFGYYISFNSKYLLIQPVQISPVKSKFIIVNSIIHFANSIICLQLKHNYMEKILWKSCNWLCQQNYSLIKIKSVKVSQ